MLMIAVDVVDGFVHYDLDTYPDRKNGPPTYQHVYSLDYCASDPSYIVRVGDSRALNEMGDFLVPEIDPYPLGGAIFSTMTACCV